jgi:hypothetical protein
MPISAHHHVVSQSYQPLKNCVKRKEGGWAGAPRVIRICHFGRHPGPSHLTNDTTPNPASDKWDSHVDASAAAPHPAWKGSSRIRGNPRSTEEGWHCTTSWYAGADLAGARRSCHSIRMDVVFPARFSRFSCTRHVDGCLRVAAASRMRAWI